MEEFATKVFTLDNNDNDVIPSFGSQINKTNSLNSVQVQLNSAAETFHQEQDTKKSKKVSAINQYYAYFPDFYKKELNNSFIMSVVWGILLTVATAICSWFVAEIVMSPVLNNWTLLSLIPVYGLVVSLFVVYLVKYLNFKNEAKTINFKDEKVVSTNVLKLYKSLRVGYINVNWMSLLSYTLFLLTLLVNCIVCYSMYPTHFGDVYTPIHENNNWAFAIVFWISVSSVLITFIIQACALVGNYVRYSRIENFYNFSLVANEEMVLLKKKTNRRDVVIYLGITCTLLLICWLIVKLFKRKKQTKVVVNA